MIGYRKFVPQKKCSGIYGKNTTMMPPALRGGRRLGGGGGKPANLGPRIRWRGNPGRRNGPTLRIKLELSCKERPNDRSPVPSRCSRIRKNGTTKSNRNTKAETKWSAFIDCGPARHPPTQGRKVGQGKINNNQQETERKNKRRANSPGRRANSTKKKKKKKTLDGLG